MGRDAAGAAKDAAVFLAGVAAGAATLYYLIQRSGGSVGSADGTAAPVSARMHMVRAQKGGIIGRAHVCSLATVITMAATVLNFLESGAWMQEPRLPAQ